MVVLDRLANEEDMRARPATRYKMDREEISTERWWISTTTLKER
jgi:hypothetical protein